MSRPAAQATVAFASRVPADVDAQRRRLQARLGCSMGALIAQALHALEASIHNDLKKNAPANRGETESPDVSTPRAGSAQ
jgi:hypothetical protein